MKGEPGEGPMHEKKESRSYEKRESMREYGSKKDMNRSGLASIAPYEGPFKRDMAGGQGACCATFSYPTGTIPTAKVSMGAQKTNPARRNRSY